MPLQNTVSQTHDIDNRPRSSCERCSILRQKQSKKAQAGIVAGRA